MPPLPPGRIQAMESVCTPDRCVECPEQVICHCLQVTEGALLEVLQTMEVRTLADVRRCTGAGDGCTACHKRIKHLLERNG
jgi:NAD(P)H-nitrite reductase large subunit